MKWKRFVVLNVKLIAQGLNDQYLQTRIAETECMVLRIDGDIDRANSCLDSGYCTIPTIGDNRMHVAAGQARIQRSLNCIQVEELSKARTILDEWCPLNPRVSLMETAVAFRKAIILGRALRYQGDFEESLKCLQMSQSIVQSDQALFLDEDLRDLTCDIAETLLELDDPISAEGHLRTEIVRRAQNPSMSSAGSLLELSLVESLFSQRRFEEAESICMEIQFRPGLLKAERLRLHIALAKLRHVKFDYEGASSYWGKAMETVRKFPNETCASQIIVLSVCDILSHTNVSSVDKKDYLLHQPIDTLSSLSKLAKPGGYRCWIAGLRQ